MLSVFLMFGLVMETSVGASPEEEGVKERAEQHISVLVKFSLTDTTPGQKARELAEQTSVRRRK